MALSQKRFQKQNAPDEEQSSTPEPEQLSTLEPEQLGTPEPEQLGTLDPQRWLEQHGDILFSIAVAQIRDSGIAEELVQDTLLAACTTSEGYQGRASERTWLHAILKHKIIDHIRKESRRRQTSIDIGDDVFLDQRFDAAGHFSPGIKPWEEDPEDALGQKHLQLALQQCIESLPERLSRAFVLREIEGYGGEDVCKALGVSSTNLWVILHRARVRLRDCLNSSWFERE